MTERVPPTPKSNLSFLNVVRFRSVCENDGEQTASENKASSKKHGMDWVFIVMSRERKAITILRTGKQGGQQNNLTAYEGDIAVVVGHRQSRAAIADLPDYAAAVTKEFHPRT